MSPPRHELESKLASAWSPASWADVTVLLAVSGGCDSVALFRAMTAIRAEGAGRVCVVHVNHQLRPDADREASFVVDLCRQWNVSCEVGRVTIGRETGIEAAARAARYRFLQEAAGRLGARYVVTAHTADDQVETILHRVFRGTGVGGLAGMSRVRPLGHATLIRPLLGVRHAELAGYLDALGQPFCEDSSNADVRFTRNRIRHELLPWLEKHIHPSVSEGVLRLGRLAGEAQSVVDQFVDELLERCVVAESADFVRMDLARLDQFSRCKDVDVGWAWPTTGNSVDHAHPTSADVEDGGAALRLTHPTNYLVRELLMAIWRRQGWPMQAMGLVQWEQLSDLTIAGVFAGRARSQRGLGRQVFPGAVSAEVVAGQLRLTRA
jgi:tRNA(Ile)-lysidine synthase